MIERRGFAFVEIKLAGDGAATGTFSGYASTFGGPPDSYGDIIDAGAFSETLKQWNAKGKLPPMLLQHGGGMFGGSPDGMLAVGEWTEMKENARGLQVKGRLFAMETERGQYIYENLKAGSLALSIGFRALKYRMGSSADEADRYLEDIELVEVSLVTFPANERATITGVKTLTPEENRECENILRDAGYSRRQSKALIVVLSKMLLRDAAEPDATLRDADVPGEIGEIDEAERAAEAMLAAITRSSLNY